MAYRSDLERYGWWLEKSRLAAGKVAREELSRYIRELKSRIQRINPVNNKDEYFAAFGELLSLEQHARALREQAAGGL